MSKAIKYNLLWSLVVVLIGLDVWLLQGRTGLRQKVSHLQAEMIQKGSALSKLSTTIRFTGHKKIANDPKPPLRLVAVFTDYGCEHCARAEIRHLDWWNKRFQHTIQVYLISPAKNLLNSFGATFPYKTISSAKGLFSAPLPIGNPLVVLVDKNDDVQAVHTDNTNIPGSDRRRIAFYKRMTSLFQSVYGNNRQTGITRKR